MKDKNRTMNQLLSLNSVIAIAGAGALCTGCKDKTELVKHPLPAGVWVEQGPGKYSTVAPEGETGPQNSEGGLPSPRVTENFDQHPQTNDWWSSMIWSWDPKEKFSTVLYPHPLSVQSTPMGLAVGYPDHLVASQEDYAYPHTTDLIAGVDGLKATDSAVDGYSDWTVTNAWLNGGIQMKATVGHGMPYVYFTELKGSASVVPQGESRITVLEGALACFEVRTHHYCAYAPGDQPWERKGEGVVAPGAKFFSVAVLPDGSQETRELFHKHAYAFVTGSEVSYELKKGKIEATYSLQVEDRAPSQAASVLAAPAESKQVRSEPAKAASEGAKEELPIDEIENQESAPAVLALEFSNAPIQALYRHQWLKSDEDFLKPTYVSPRGAMKIHAGKSFTTKSTTSSLLPHLPDAGTYKRGRLQGFVKLVANDELFKLGAEGTRDSYWQGKSFGRLGGAAQIAHQMGMTGARDKILKGIKAQLEDWFDGKQPRQYFYDEKWHTLIGTPTMYHSGAMMNDHHFHYAYYIYAAAVVGMYDKAWAQKWAPMVEMLIRDAGSWDRTDKMFPHFRYFDIYAGHSWASGTLMGPRGNNEESSSEDVNFAAALSLWGSVMNKPEIRDAGLFMHSTLQVALAQYWYDVDGEVYPEQFDHPGTGIVWGNGAAYTTWFSYQPVFIHGIQLTPMHLGMFWLGQYPDHVRKVMQHTRKGNRGPIRLWRDLFLQLESLSDPSAPIASFEEERYFEAEFGGSHAQTYHFIHNWNALGPLDMSVTADTAHYAVFKKDGKRTYVTYNFSDSPITVKFSDGTTVEAAPQSYGVAKAQ